MIVDALLRRILPFVGEFGSTLPLAAGESDGLFSRIRERIGDTGETDRDSLFRNELVVGE